MGKAPLRLLLQYKVHILAIVIKILLIFYGEFHDSHSSVKYTDIDYKVYTDAARYVTQNQSPYLRHTYRYTPLLAYICTVNIRLYDWCGKALFCLVDSIAALLLERILELTSPLKPKYTEILLAIWVFNPMSVAVSTRGNADTIISCLVILVLYLILKGRIYLAGFFFGLVVHFKIYPILYALPFYFYIDRNKGKIFTFHRVAFTLISGGLFLGLIAYFYSLYGWEFLHETYLYHLTRKDNRHNFSVYFYYIYLNFEHVSMIQSVLSFIPQISLVVLSGFKYFKDLPFCCFIQTYWFVVFNKVCTAQYFIWYMSLLPLILARNKLFFRPRKFLLMWGAWLTTELLWNLTAYYLEHQGVNDFMMIWLSSLAFFSVNVYLGVEIVKEQEITEFKVVHEKSY